MMALFARFWLFIWTSLVCAQSASAAVWVLANRTPETMALAVTRAEGRPQAIKLAPGEVVSILVTPGGAVTFHGDAQKHVYQLDPDTAYYFSPRESDGQPELQRIGLKQRPGTDRVEDATVMAPGIAVPGPEKTEAAPDNAAEEPPLEIPVKLLVDDEERASRRLWEERIRKRLARASLILERNCRVKFKVVAVETWRSDDPGVDFERGLREFETDASPDPGWLAIGFTSQDYLPDGPAYLVGIRGTLGQHLLLRELPQHMTEPERLELLVHGLGHFLGAIHCPETSSAMRPLLGDRLAVDRRFRIGVDPLNALAICLVADELKNNRARRLSDFNEYSRRKLAEIYATLGEALPHDDAQQCLAPVVAMRNTLANSSPAERSPPVTGKAAAHGGPGAGLGKRPPAVAKVDVAPPATTSRTSPIQGKGDTISSPRVEAGMLTATQAILKGLVEVARENAARPTGRFAASDNLFRLEGDRLTETLVRAAAVTARRQPKDVRWRSLVLALGIGLDKSDQLRDQPLIGSWLRRVESDDDRRDRLSVLGSPTLRGRYDLTQHFFVSAALASLAGDRLAESVGLAKELRDAEGGSGFSFSDYCADLAGIAFTRRLAGDSELVGRLSRSFRVTDYFPDVTDLPDGLDQAEFARRYGSTTDPRFNQARQDLLDRLGLVDDVSAQPAPAAKPPAVPEAAPTEMGRRAPWTTSRLTGTPDPSPPYQIERVFGQLSFKYPVDLSDAPGSDRLFVVEQEGKIYSWVNRPGNASPEQASPEPDLFFDLKSAIPGVTVAYGLTFDPDFRENHYCYLCYVLEGGRKDGTRVSRFVVESGDPPRVKPDSEQILLTFLGLHLEHRPALHERGRGRAT